jgi:hypothetical protein
VTEGNRAYPGVEIIILCAAPNPRLDPSCWFLIFDPKRFWTEARAIGSLALTQEGFIDGKR